MAILENISSIRIKGGIFEAETDLSLFEKDKQVPRFSLLYGKNGTGKSTISRAFRKLTGIYEKQIDLVDIFDAENNAIPVTNEIKDAIYVFNEEFIEDNIRIDGDGLNTIVVMGAVKDIDDKIKKIEPDYIKSVENVKKQQELYNQYMDVKNEMSPDYYVDEMQKTLKGDENWVGRDTLILGKKTNSQVKKDTYMQFLALSLSKKEMNLLLNLVRCFNSLKMLKLAEKR